MVVKARAIGTVWEEGERFMERVGRGSAERGAVGGRQGDMLGGEADGRWRAAGLQAAIGQTRECRGRQVFGHEGEMGWGWRPGQGRGGMVRKAEN